MKFVFLSAACLVLCINSSAAKRPGIEYSRPGHERLRMDAGLPEGTGPFPAAIIVHGGAWVTGSRKLDVSPLFKPLETAGFAWFTIGYRAARKPPFSGSAIDVSKIDYGIEDVEHAVEYVRKHAAEFHVDPNRIVLIGESAGAQLASMAAIRGAAVKGVVALYCPSDLAAIARPSGVVRGVAARLTWGGVSAESVQAVSPIEAVHPGMPPFLFIHGTADHVVPFEQSTRMCAEMQRVGGHCEVVPVPRGLHGVHLWELFRQTSYKRQMIDWLTQNI